MLKTNVFVKICGITRPQDLICAVDEGAAAVGFIAFKKSPRFVTPQQVKLLLKNCPKHIKKVVVVVDASQSEIQQYIDQGIDTVQLHGSETAEFANSIKGAAIWRAVRLADAEQIKHNQHFPCEHFVIDSFVKDSALPGGTGQLANWQFAKQFVQSVKQPVLLAGGINPDNAVQALQTVNCYGLDLSSGVETAPGIKDHAAIHRLFRNLKQSQ